MTRLLLGSGALLAAVVLSAGTLADEKKEAAKDDKGWVQLFNGKDLTGWKAHPDSLGKWEVKDGAIVGSGKDASHLFSERGDFENFHYRIEAKISDKGNSGQYFRAKFAPGFPPGYEAQINATFPSDPVRTGSLYPSGHLKLSREDRKKIIVTKQLHKPDEWFTQEVSAEGNHIIIKVNGVQTVDFVDKNNTFARGHFAIQQHPPAEGAPESVITVRKVEVKELPATGT
jgi:hypothetical protein